MEKIKFYISIFLAKFISFGIKLLSRSSGTSLVGLITLKLNPDFLKNCQKYINKEIITVTGTNGKTTTSGLIAQILENNKNKVIHNSLGANMLTGIANVMATNISPLKRFDNAVLESDEAYLTKLYDFIKADYLVVTNLFRDQLDRYGELDTTAKMIKSAIDKNPDLKLVLNADDPIVANLKGKNETIYYGFEDIEFVTEREISQAPQENFNCICGNNLQYNKRFYAQEGHYYCNCGYKRPDCQYKAIAKIYDEHIELILDDMIFNVELIGLYNAYNALASITLALTMGYSQEQIQTALNSYKAIFGRAEKTTIKGHPTIIQLIKNPAGASEVLKTVDTTSNILIAINDNFADGRDVSWLWDAEFELLKNTQKPIVISGIRAEDMALRLKYAGVPVDKIKIIKDIFDGINYISKNTNTGEKITILPTYTALLKIKKN